jgi:hypothetical protein
LQPAVSKNGLFAPFIYQNEHFTKTGSGQTQGKLKKGTVFPPLGMGDDPVPLFLPLESPMVGYCVEMLDAPFSRYQSCNGCGECPSFSLSFPFLSFPYACPEPVWANARIYIRMERRR